jgi:hypothetical protein
MGCKQQFLLQPIRIQESLLPRVCVHRCVSVSQGDRYIGGRKYTSVHKLCWDTGFSIALKMHNISAIKCYFNVMLYFCVFRFSVTRE